MGRCGRCSRSPCECTSSSSSLSSISLGPRDQYTTGELALCPSVSDAQERFRCTDKSRRVRALESYAVDTYNIKYRRRVLQVPSCEYPKLDDALASLQVTAGGYIISLAPDGIYTMSASLCKNVDDLIIQGDCDPFSGVTYSRRCIVEGSVDRDPPPVQPFPVCRTRWVSQLGMGPFDIVVNGSDIVVYGVSLRGERDASRDPCFDSICGREIRMFSANGTFVSAVADGRGNTLSVNQTIPFDDRYEGPEANDSYVPYRRSCSGFGFFFPPRVVIQGRNNISLNTLDSLKIIGCTLDLGPVFFAGSENGAVSLSNCWIKNNVGFFSDFFCENPNVWTGFCYCIAASRGTMNYQAFVGPFAHLTVDSAIASVNYSLFATNIHAIEVNNGGTLNMLGCEVVNCCLGLTAYQGGVIAIPDCRFCCNLYTLYAAYLSTITSVPVNVPGQDTTRVYASPWFIHNVFIFIASMNSYIIIPNFRASRNLVPGILDGQVHTRLESIHVDLIGRHNSCFVYLPSASTPSPIGLGCITRESIPGALTESYMINLINANSWSVATGSFIRSIVGDTGVSVTAAESLARLATDMNDGDTEGDQVPF